MARNNYYYKSGCRNVGYGYPPVINGFWNNGWVGQQTTVWQNPQYRMTSRVSVGVIHGDYESVYAQLNFGSNNNVYSQRVEYKVEYPYQGRSNYRGYAPNHASEIDFTQDWDFAGNSSYRQRGKQLKASNGRIWSKNNRSKYQHQGQSTRKQPYRKNSKPNCFKCGQTFVSYNALYAHKDSAHNDFKCRVCGKAFRSYGFLKRHEAAHSIHPCLECPETFTAKESMIAHMAHAHGKGPQACNTPALTAPLTQTQTSPENEDSHFTSPVASSTPTGSFAAKSTKESSVQTIDSGISVKIEEFVCPYCIKKCDSENLLLSHLQIHTEATKDDPQSSELNALSCPYCIKKCDSEKSLVSHVKIHSEVTKVISVESSGAETSDVFPCSYCDTAFESEDLLKTHSKIHSQATNSVEVPKDPKAAPMFCPFCAHVFYTRRDLALHMTSKHTEVHYCSKCDAEYSTEAELNAHRKVHYGAGEW